MTGIIYRQIKRDDRAVALEHWYQDRAPETRRFTQTGKRTTKRIRSCSTPPTSFCATRFWQVLL